MSRLEFQLNALTQRQREIYDEIAAGPRRSVQGPLLAWLASPEFAHRAQTLGLACRFESSLEPRLAELAVLSVAAYWKSEFEWQAHAPLALKAGLSSVVVDALAQGMSPPFSPDEATVHAFATELLTQHRVSDATFQRAQALLDNRGVVDLIGILSYYTLIVMTIAAYEIPAPTGSAVFDRAKTATF